MSDMKKLLIVTSISYHFDFELFPTPFASYSQMAIVGEVVLRDSWSLCQFCLYTHSPHTHIYICLRIENPILHLFYFLNLHIYINMVNVPIAPIGPETEGVFVQQLTPIGGSLIGSFFVGLIPLLLVLVLLGVFKVKAHFASLSGLIVWWVYYLRYYKYILTSQMIYSIFIAIFGWHMPAQQAFESIGNGIVFANWPIMWIVVNAM